MTVADRILTYQRRVERLAKALDGHSLDALLVTNPENRRYLTGFTGHDSGWDSAGTLLVAGNTITLITDGRYTEQAEHESPAVRIVKREGELAPALAKVIREAGVARIGFEAMNLTVAQRDDIAAAVREQAGDAATPELVATRRLVEPQRAVKDADELAAIERACAITDETFAYLCGYLQPGMTERQVAREIERYMLERGAEGLAFDSSVASGPNAAMPHATPTDRELAMGETIVLDMGARYAGYCSDMTRTVCLGDPGEQAQHVFDAVLRAQETCESGLRPSMNGKQGDALARDSLVTSGYGEQFLHGTGHGLGLEIHEDPRVGRFAEDSIVEAGMVLTVEPGIYIAGWGGVRIEDTVLLTEDGARPLTHSHKRLVLPR